MAKTIQAKTLAQVSYTFTETTTNRSITDSDSYQNASNYTFSSSGGDFTVNNVARATGQLPSGGVVNIDTTAFAVEALGNSYNINFTGVKSIVIQNTSTVQGFDFNVAATGSNALTELFNGGSGNIEIAFPAASNFAQGTSITIHPNGAAQLIWSEDRWFIMGGLDSDHNGNRLLTINA